MTCQSFKKRAMGDPFMMVNLVASGSLVRSGEPRRREYQTANNETIMRIPSGNSRVVFIYFSRAILMAVTLNKKMLRFLDTQRVGRETCQCVPFIFVNIEDAQEVGQ